MEPDRFETLYRSLNHRKFVHPDPIEFLYDYCELRDREIVGLIASSLAYGRVGHILKSVSRVLSKMGLSPFSFLMSSSTENLENTFQNFRHRFTSDEDLISLLRGIRGVLKKHGSLYSCFCSKMEMGDKTIFNALSSFVHEINAYSPNAPNFLIPIPERGSACKRLHLFLRWMVRKDAVDPGGWDGIPPSKLIIPLDTHMFKIAAYLGATKRRQADLKAAVEITDAFRLISPGDPIRYDFALTRLGIRKDLNFICFVNGEPLY
jgi:uncharacterized protein (TIGR02757 family)